MTEAIWFLIKTLLAAFIVSFISWFAGKKPALAGLMLSFPLLSMLSILFSYWQYKDMDKIGQFCLSILLAVPLSLLFFLPFVLYRSLKMGFVGTFLLAIICTTAGYFAAVYIFKTELFR